MTAVNGPPIIASLRSATDAFFDTHLMIEAPDRSIEQYVAAGSNSVTVHAETCPHLHRTLGAINDLGARARDGKLAMEELMGGTFTISNGGVYGSMLSTPIVNPPQSGVLGLHAIQDRAMVIDGEITVRPMMYVALTYDHRLVDGREGVSFLKHIKEVIEAPERLMLEI